MSSAMNNQAKTDWRSKLRFSIAARLNIKMWLWLLSFFISLNILLFGAGFILTVSYGERQLAAIAPYLDEIESLAANQLIGVSGISVEQLEAEPRGLVLPEFLKRAVADETAAFSRSFKVLSPPLAWPNLQKMAKQLAYRVEFAQGEGGSAWGLTISLEPAARPIMFILGILLVVELITLVSRFFNGIQQIRETLTPLTELAKQAQSLNAQRGPFTVEEMRELAGKLEGINAARLDTRIDIKTTQDELKGLAQAINQMLDRINESYRAQARFVSDASHELRTPIAAIQGYVNLLDRWGKYDEKALQESIDAIKEETANMKELVEQLLFLARGDSNRMPLHVERLDLKDVAAAVYKETEMIHGGHDFTIEADTVFVEGDAGLIKQALRILVDNAIKYTPAGGKIRIMVSREHNQARMIVQDNGIGIPPEAVPHVFERFFRADESRARATGGTGLGLSIAKWIVERHGGHMEVLSRQDVGTRVGIVLPAAD
ncbi:MAG: ATP-binding protein [Limnochordia bacterium]|jgi:two-component system sensor histidine kinase ArlS|nr:ATP-binding protein [Bacillota bacterium]NLH32058.1 HAMP domain-containing protein [Bacillota bacterium]